MYPDNEKKINNSAPESVHCKNTECPFHPVNNNMQNIFCDGLNRYYDESKFITDSNKLKVVDETYVFISNEDDYDIAIDLEDNVSEFEKFKPYIVFLTKYICELDKMVQIFDSLKHKRGKPVVERDIISCKYLGTESTSFESNNLDDVPFILSSIYFEDYSSYGKSISFEYWCTNENSQFNAIFEYKDDRFHLRKFGIIDDITDDWEKVLLKRGNKKDADI